MATNLKSVKATALTSVITSVASPGVKITGLTYPGGASAGNPAGGETITVNGSGFNSGATVYIDTLSCSTTYVSSTSLTFTSPTKSIANYHLFVYNTDGSVGMLPGGMIYSAMPIWVTSSGSLGMASIGLSFSYTVSATGDGTVTYGLSSGSLPSGLSLNTNTGAITGTPSGSAATFNFVISATDSQNQVTTRSFSIEASNGSELFTPAGKTKLLGLQFNSSGLTITGSWTVTTYGSLSYQATGGIKNTGYATGWSTSNYLTIDQINNATASTMRGKTYMAWYKGTETASKPTGNYSPSVPIFAELTGSVYWGLGVDDGKIIVSSGIANKGSTSINTGSWFFLAWVVKSNSNVDAYVNGVKELTNISVNASYPGTKYIGNGYNYGPMENPTALDAIQIIDGELTDIEILSIYTQATQ